MRTRARAGSTIHYIVLLILSLYTSNIPILRVGNNVVSIRWGGKGGESTGTLIGSMYVPTRKRGIFRVIFIIHLFKKIRGRHRRRPRRRCPRSVRVVRLAYTHTISHRRAAAAHAGRNVGGDGRCAAPVYRPRSHVPRRDKPN